MIAYCLKSRRVATAEAVSSTKGQAIVLTSPPTVADNIDVGQWLQHDLLWFALEAGPDSNDDIWHGDNGIAALRADQIPGGLDGAIVFIATCFAPTSPFIQRFLDCGAAAVIAGKGLNYTDTDAVLGADTLGSALIFFLEHRFNINWALFMAKASTVMDFRPAAADARQFEVYGNGLAKLRRFGFD